MKVRPFTDGRIDADLYLTAIGYESRARHISSTLPYSASRRVALQFSDTQELDFNKNKKFFIREKFDVISTETSAIEQLLRDFLTEEKKAFLTVCLDVSCMTRE